MDINEITYAINGAIFEVSRVLGAGFLERVYENALLIELRSRGLKQVGLLVDFKHRKADIKRMVLDLPAPSRGDESPFGKRHDS